MDRSPGFGSTPSDYSPCSDSISLRLPYSVNLATECKSLTHYTKGTPSPLGSDFLYACGFRIYFTPLPGFFSPFPHGTCSLSVNDEYLALEDGPPIFRQDYTCPALLVARPVPHPTFHIRGYHPLWPDFPFRFAKPDAKTCRLLRFRSPLLSESRLMSFPRATEMFQFTRFASYPYVFRARYLYRWVSPFGYLRIKAHLPAPRSFSQAITSFIACNRQGIHHMHLVT